MHLHLVKADVRAGIIGFCQSVAFVVAHREILSVMKYSLLSVGCLLSLEEDDFLRTSATSIDEEASGM